MQVKAKNSPKRRGRPPGRSEQGERTREQLFAVAVELFGDKGFEGTTLRAIAAGAGVSPGLLYRYFPSKRAVVLELYERLSAELVRRAEEMPRGSWAVRFGFALKASLDVLGPYRETLGALTGVLVGRSEESLFAPSTAFSRERVQGVFVEAVAGARDRLADKDSEALGRVLYLAHLSVILWWLLDRSPGQRATERLIDWVAGLSRVGGAVLRAPGVKPMLRRFDGLIGEGLFADSGGVEA